MWRESKITRVSIMSESVRTTQLTENDAFGSRLETKENRIIIRTFNRQPQPYWNEPTQTNTTKIHCKQVKEPDSQSTNRIRILSGLKSFVFPHWQSCKSQITLTKMCWRISQTPFSQMWVISQHPLTYKQPQGMLGPGARSPEPRVGLKQVAADDLWAEVEMFLWDRGSIHASARCWLVDILLEDLYLIWCNCVPEQNSTLSNQTNHEFVLFPLSS